MKSIVDQRFAGMPETQKRCAACHRVWYAGHDCGTGSRKGNVDDMVTAGLREVK